MPGLFARRLGGRVQVHFLQRDLNVNSRVQTRSHDPPTDRGKVCLKALDSQEALVRRTLTDEAALVLFILPLARSL
jgi:hypothetical protein